MAISIALITICAWISLPFAVPFTLQTFAVYFVLGLLGGKKGTAAIAVYILLGAVGVPVFHSFTGGLGIIFGNTGGYMLGFVLSGLILWGAEKIFGNSTKVFIAASLAGLLVCYAFGTLWFMALYMKTTGPVGLTAVLGWCVFPFVIPDLIKIALAVVLSKRVSKAIGTF